MKFFGTIILLWCLKGFKGAVNSAPPPHDIRYKWIQPLQNSPRISGCTITEVMAATWADSSKYLGVNVSIDQHSLLRRYNFQIIQNDTLSIFGTVFIVDFQWFIKRKIKCLFSVKKYNGHVSIETKKMIIETKTTNFRKLNKSYLFWRIFFCSVVNINTKYTFPAVYSC